MPASVPKKRLLDKSTKKKEDIMCKIAIRNAGMKQVDIARVLNVSQSVVSRHFKEHRERVAVLEKGNGLHYFLSARNCY